MRQTFIIIILAFINWTLVYTQNIDIKLYENIPMRDGIKLSANIYSPNSNEKSYPVILIYTPYVNDEAVERGMYFAKEGYIFITLDLRGRGNSEGEYRPFEKDGIDGYDAIQWISQQDWCNGNIGMMGGSYRGMVQWMTLKNKPTALKTIVPTAAVGPGIDFPKFDGIFGNYALQWLNFTGGKSRNNNLFNNGTFWNNKATKKHKMFIPYKDWDLLALNKRNSVFQTWISHPDFDEYWQSFYPTPEDYKSFDLPILTITGYFDADQPGAMTYYEDHMKYGNPTGKTNHYLILGPWSHVGTRKPVTELGGLTFGNDSKLDMKQLHLEWFNWTLKNGKKPEFLKDRVSYYLMNKNKWKYLNEIGNISKDTITYYLSSPDSNSKLLIDPGYLSQKKSSVLDADIIVYDPLDTEEIEGYSGFDYYTAPIPIEEKGRIIYVSNKLDTNTRIVGRFEVGLYLSLNVPDTDIQVSLYVVNELGETKYIGSDMLRLRYREGLNRPKLAVPGEVFFCKFDTPYITALELKRGNRFILTINSMNFSYIQKNYNSGKDVSLESKIDAKTAEITVHHSSEHPSYIKIPVGHKN
ncbi:CocE/NonD family hydrolase [Aquimarina sp. 2201CG5-10]|uniref:CocE/NonD family hydrolase n=1 Tax=Aquimarina callyspongiae TaxID=3098150 RepID=UPI002AB45C51|nr:CocE/NonD family hydrolase [Aquimarina sp. 2201CG5-10]MDY8135421.1 CocE/NonD family hydrolase [Aquimarina sp. 2201CG5-10]